MKIGDKAFKKLQAKWDRKLKDSGFEDAEQRSDGNLKKWHSFVFGRHAAHLVNLPAREEYYRLARQFLWEWPFQDSLHRRMWELHSEGVSIVDISSVLTKEFTYIYKRKVHETLQQLAKEMLEQCRNRS